MSGTKDVVDRSELCCDACRYVLVVNVRLKTHPENAAAEGVPTGGYSIADLLEHWEDIKYGPSYGAQNAFSEEEIYAFSPDGKQDRVTSDSKYVFLAKVVRACDLVDIKGRVSYEYQAPQGLHHNLGTREDYVLRDNVDITFAFHLKKTT